MLLELYYILMSPEVPVHIPSEIQEMKEAPTAGQQAYEAQYAPVSPDDDAIKKATEEEIKDQQVKAERKPLSHSTSPIETGSGAGSIQAEDIDDPDRKTRNTEGELDDRELTLGEKLMGAARRLLWKLFSGK